MSARTSRLPGLEGRAALVTGGSRGIGRATVIELARSGADVGVAFRADREAAEAVVRQALEAGARLCWSFPADLREPHQVDALFAESDRRFGGRLDVFVGNAGIWNETDTPIAGHVFVIFILTVAAAEASVALALAVAVYRNRGTVDIDRIDLLKF